MELYAVKISFVIILILIFKSVDTYIYQYESHNSDNLVALLLVALYDNPVSFIDRTSLRQIYNKNTDK